MTKFAVVAVLLCLGQTAAFAPRGVIRPVRSSLRTATDDVTSSASAPEKKSTSAPETEAPPPQTAPAPASTASPSVIDMLKSASGGEMPVSNFKPRDRDQWADDAGYGRFAEDSESAAYKYLMASPVGKVDFLTPIVEKVKTRPELLDGTHAGDYGFDPLNLAKSEDLLFFYMESEVKHSRLAMLACAGWIGAELAGGSGLASNGRAPAILNGHLFDLQNLATVVLLFGAWGYLEHATYPAQYIKHTPNNGKYNYQHYMDGPYAAGNLEFDPLNLYNALGDDAIGRKAMRELEIAHGRFAMMGITLWVMFEAATTAPVAQAFGCFFKPFWAWGLPFMGENPVIGTLEFVSLLGAGAFVAYNNLMEIDSMKYQGDGDEDFSMFG